MLKYDNSDFSVITYRGKKENSDEIKILWKKPGDNEMCDNVFGWVMDILTETDSEKYFEKLGNKGIYGFESIKYLEEGLLSRGLNSGVDKVAVILPRDILNSVITTPVKNIEYFPDEKNAKDWINEIKN